MTKSVDILIIGSGISALFFAIKTAIKCPNKSILILTKSSKDNNSTRYAQGGIAIVTDFIKDDFTNHIEDTLRAGKYTNKLEVVEMVIKQAPERLEELIRFNIDFDKNPDGTWNLGLEGGHSQHRILHHKDISGLEIERKLLQKLKDFPNISLNENTAVLNLTQNNKNCIGVFYYDRKSKTTDFIFSNVTVLCTGGCGQVFKRTTNPEIATGDGLAMAHKIGAEIQDMHNIQFHPTALYEKNKNQYFLISEAVRGFGAYIINQKGERFVFKHDVRGELATRDIVSEAIETEMKKNGTKFVYLDCRHLDENEFNNHFPTIVAYCNNIGLSPKTDLIPILPVAHYQCGGIVVDKNSQTTVPRLFAIGECSYTGLHGNNRLASNSLLEALVYAHQCSEYLVDNNEIFTSPKIENHPLPSFQISTNNNNLQATEIRQKLQKIITQGFLNQLPLDFAKERITEIYEETKLLASSNIKNLETVELENMTIVATLIIDAKIQYSKLTSTNFP